MAGGAIISHYAAKSATNAAMQRTPEEQQALTGAQTGAKTLQTGGADALATGADTQRPATNYYDTLLRGDRAAQAQATAAPAARISDVYSGATRNLEQSGVRGAAKDVASADLNKNRASSLAGLVTGVQPGAAAALTSIGETQQNRGAGMISSANNTYSDLLGAGQKNRQAAQGAGTSVANSIGQLTTGAAKIAGDWWAKRSAANDAARNDANFGG
jgi:hypothetical protein